MSIYDELRARVKAGDLFFVQPLDIEGAILARQLYVSPSINSLLEGPWESEDWSDRCAALQADLHMFVAGDMIAGRIPPSKNVEAYIALLEPPSHEVWEIRSSDALPQLRIFGRFAAMDCFVGLTWNYRSRLPADAKWSAAMETCKAEWRRLFTYPPYQGADVHDFVSKKIYPV